MRFPQLTRAPLTSAERQTSTLPKSRISLPFQWNAGDHMSVMGQTGSGKTYAMVRILGARKYVTAIKTKSDRTSFPSYYETVTDPRELRRSLSNHNLLDVSKDFRAVRARKIAYFYQLALEQKGWTVYNDETFYITQKLKLEEWIEELQTQGRSQYLTIVCGMQRPVRISRFILSESTHVLSFDLEPRDRKIIEEVTTEKYAAAVAQLRRHEFAWYHRPSKRIWIGKVNELENASIDDA